MNRQELLTPLIDFLKIPSISMQAEYKNDMAMARAFLVNIFNSIGCDTKILKGEKHDAVFASLIIDKKLPTVLIYGHYDVQPPDPLDEWKTPPFKPTIKLGKIYARGSADNKAQHMIHIMAVKNLIQKSKKLKINCKFLIEGEEEVGSTSISNLAKKYADNLLKCDYLIVSDTGMRPGQPCIDIGLRGLVYTEIKIQTAKHDLHSGECGGIAENPINLLAHVISKLKDKNAKVQIPGFYKDVKILSEKELAELNKVQKSTDEELRDGELYGIGGGEEGYTLGERKWTQPTLDVNGIWGGYQGKGSKTIIPSYAAAKISMRLVPNQDNDKVFLSFERYVKTLIPKWVKIEIIRYSDCLPYIAPTNHPVFKLMAQCLKNVYGKNPIFKRMSGSIGFVPIMAKALKVPVLMIGFALPGAKIHSPNEHFSLSNYYKGIAVMEDFYNALAGSSSAYTNSNQIKG